MHGSVAAQPALPPARPLRLAALLERATPPAGQECDALTRSTNRLTLLTSPLPASDIICDTDAIFLNFDFGPSSNQSSFNSSHRLFCTLAVVGSSDL